MVVGCYPVVERPFDMTFDFLFIRTFDMQYMLFEYLALHGDILAVVEL